MKAKDLKLGDICYRPDTDTIKSLKVVRLGFDTDGDILITFHNDSMYDKGAKGKAGCRGHYYGAGMDASYLLLP